MVYESDFYTTRRVGSSYTRPTISSYTVTTPLRYSGASREFEDEKRDIRNSTALLLRQLNDPVPRMLAPVAQAAPEPNPKKWVYDPFSAHNRLNSDTYVKSHITDPIRSVRNDIEAMARYHSPASRYVEYVLLDDILWRYTYYVDEDGKNHLASTRIIGSQAYPKTKPRIYNYDTAKVGKDVNVMSYYKSNRTQAKADVEEDLARVQRKLHKRVQRSMMRAAKEALEDYKYSRLPKKASDLKAHKKRKAYADALSEPEQETTLTGQCVAGGEGCQTEPNTEHRHAGNN
uniref:Uncharacterized protein n=1 Tax=Anopheles atroparvus TaxID=41427 RepID=A0AAG5CX47_ANOAO